MASLKDSCSILDWDSEFFGFVVGSVEIGKRDDFGKLPRVSPEVPVGVCYVSVAPEINSLIEPELSRLGGLYCGSRVVYRLDLLGRGQENNDKDICTLDSLDESLYKLAISAGWCSRFLHDSRFSGKFESMYRIWIEKCFAKQQQGRCAILGMHENGELIGFVAVSHDAGIGKIDLIAVDPSFRSRGYGKRLVVAAINHAIAAGCSCMQVVTQGQNESGCRTYKACGMQQVERREIWHLPM